MNLRWQLEHWANERWEETPLSITLDMPDAASQLLQLKELSSAFEGVLKILACEDPSINFEQERVVFYSQSDSHSIRGYNLKQSKGD